MSGRTPRYSRSSATLKIWKVSAVSVSIKRSALDAGPGPFTIGEVISQRSRTAYISPKWLKRYNLKNANHRGHRAFFGDKKTF